MEAKHLISIIIPIYNSEKSLRRCLNSVIAQTYQDLQIILVDDGSTDNSGSICEEYAHKDHRIKVVHQENRGASFARNVGIVEACGDWIAFIDSDDFVGPEYISNMTNSVNCDLVVSDCRIEQAEEYNSDFETYLQKFVHSHNTLWNKIHKTSIIKNHKLWFDENVRFGEDTLFYLSYLPYCKQIIVIPQNEYNYNITDIPSERYVLSVDEIKEMGDKILQRYDVLSKAFNIDIDTNYDRTQIVSMYPIKKLLIIGDDEYLDLFRYYFPQAGKTELYQDRLCSPMIRIVSYVKSLYLHHKYEEGYTMLSSAYKMYKSSFLEANYPYRMHQIIGWLLGHGRLHIVVIISLCYSIFKR